VESREYRILEKRQRRVCPEHAAYIETKLEPKDDYSSEGWMAVQVGNDIVEVADSLSSTKIRKLTNIRLTGLTLKNTKDGANGFKFYTRKFVVENMV